MYKNVLVPLDGSELAECVLLHVETIAKGCGAENVTFVRVVEPVHLPYSEEEGYAIRTTDWQKVEADSIRAAAGYLDRVVGKIKYNSVKVKSQVLTGGRAAEKIAEYAMKNTVDLIVIATHGRSGVTRLFMGSVAERVVRSACVPVLIVRAPGCEPSI